MEGRSIAPVRHQQLNSVSDDVNGPEREVNMINLLKGSIEDRIKYAKSLSKRQLNIELKNIHDISKPINNSGWLRSIDGEIKVVTWRTPADEDYDESLRLFFDIDGKTFFSINLDGEWSESRYDHKGRKIYFNFRDEAVEIYTYSKDGKYMAKRLGERGLAIYKANKKYHNGWEVVNDDEPWRKPTNKILRLFKRR